MHPLQIQQVKQILSEINPLKVNRPKAAAVLMILCNDPLELLFTVRSKDLNNHAGQISFPGGKQEPSESLKETALRETKEEIGLTNIDLLGHFYNLPSKASDVYVSAFVGYKQHINIKELVLNNNEVSEAFLVPMRYFVDQKRTLLNTCYTFKYNHHIIWGLTGYLTKRFVTDVYQLTKDLP